MEDAIKKFVYTGVAFSSFTVERLQESIDNLVKNEKITVDEGKTIVDNFLAKAESRKNEWEGKVRESLENVVQAFKGKQGSSLEDLEARIEALEGTNA